MHNDKALSKETSRVSNPPGMRSLPSRKTAPLWPETERRLKNISPDLAWLEIEAAYSHLAVNEPETLANLVRPVGVAVEELIPKLTHGYAMEQILNSLAMENPELDLSKLTTMDPLLIVEAFLKTVSTT